MRLLVCAAVAGCGGLTSYEIPDASSPLPAAPEGEEIVPWKGGDDPPDALSGVPGSIEGPMHLLTLVDAVSPLVPGLETLLGDADNLVVRLDMIDSPNLEVRIAAVTQGGDQDFCVPTIDATGAFDGRDFRIVLPGHNFQISDLPWRGLVLEGALEGNALVDLVLWAELPSTVVPLTDVCGELTCLPCSALPGVEHEICAHVPLELGAEPLQGLVIEPLTSGDAEASCR